jgi:C4-dicarboxylate-specific signal transduction histidine kinase
LQKLVDLGIEPDLTEPLKKRIRLTNAVSLFGAFVMLGSIPFDLAHAPPWMLLEDVVGGLAYLTLPLLNRRGRLMLARLFCIALSNLIVLSNAVLLGPESGAQMVFIALCAVPFALFDVSERSAIAFSVFLSVACFAVAVSGRLAGLQSVTESYSAATYYLYSAVITFLALVFSLHQTSQANARAEEALRNDIRERRRAERELELTRQASIHSAKMAALGEMSGNIGHEINNPLAAILLRAQRLQRLVTKEQVDLAAVAKAANDVETTVHRIRRIVDALRSFARDGDKGPLRAEPIRGIVSDTVDLCAQRFRQHDIELRIDAIPEDLHVECRAVQISQILLNLLSNAHDAVENRTTRWVQISAEAVGETVRLAVIDSGPGIPPELEDRIMEPFFTTKEIGKGTGLGLSVAQGIAATHGGRLHHDLTSPHTRFVLTLRRGRPGGEPGGG